MGIPVDGRRLGRRAVHGVDAAALVCGPGTNAPMGGVAGRALASAVTDAGGLGMIGVGSAGSVDLLEREVALPAGRRPTIRHRAARLGDGAGPRPVGRRRGHRARPDLGELRHRLDVDGRRPPGRDRGGHPGGDRGGGEAGGGLRGGHHRCPGCRGRRSRLAGRSGRSPCSRASWRRCRCRSLPPAASRPAVGWRRCWPPVPPAHGSGRRSRRARNRSRRTAPVRRCWRRRPTDTVTTRVFDLALGYPWPERYPERVIRDGFWEQWQGRERELEAQGGPTSADGVGPGRPAPHVDAGQGVGAVTRSLSAAEVVGRLHAGALELLQAWSPGGVADG